MSLSSFGADIESGRADLQVAAESAMVDTVLIDRKSGTSLDPDTLEQVDTFELVYQGRCKVRSTPIQAGTAVAGEVAYDVSHSYIDLPVSDAAAMGVRSGDRAVLTVTRDPANAGRRFVVQRDVPRTFGVERRLFCEEVS